jgi:dolichol-phosphate mannosyltransferase
MLLSIIIPVYNEQATITEVLDKLLAVKFPCDTEIIVADDGSTDETARKIAEYGRTNLIKKHTSLINLGKGAAVRFGLEYAEGDLVIIQDADLELDPNDILRLLEEMERTGADAVFGSRFAEGRRKFKNASRANIAANVVMTSYTNLLYGSDLTDISTAYKLIKRSVIERIRLRCVGFEFEPEITAKLLRLGHVIRETPVTYTPRTSVEGKKIGWWDGFKYMYYLTKYRLVKPESFQKKASSQVRK